MGSGGKDLVPLELIDSRFVQANDSGYFQSILLISAGAGCNEDSTMANPILLIHQTENSEVIWYLEKGIPQITFSFYPNGY